VGAVRVSVATAALLAAAVTRFRQHGSAERKSRDRQHQKATQALEKPERSGLARRWIHWGHGHKFYGI